MPPIRLLTFSTLYPNEAQPNHGIFVENRLRHLIMTGEATARVLAPVPWFPSDAAVFGTWGRYARAPRSEARHGIHVDHPRYVVIPRISMTVAPALLARAGLLALRRMLADGFRFDLIDAHYVYPDGVAAIRIGAVLDIPVVITARGSDVTQLPNYAGPRRQIAAAVGRAAALIGVSAALCARLIELGAPPDRVTALRNGVDTDGFRPPADRAAARAALGLSGPTLLSVGGLVPRKRHHLTVAAMTELPGYSLLIAGEGPEQARLATDIARLDLGGRVRLLGSVPHTELPAYYGAADAMVLASAREGWANVLLESMACGTPVIAGNIPGNPEVVQSPDAGLIMDETTPRGIAAAVRALFAAPPRRAATRAYAERFGWEETSRGQLAVFHRVLAQARNRSAAPAIDRDEATSSQ